MMISNYLKTEKAVKYFSKCNYEMTFSIIGLCHWLGVNNVKGLISIEGENHFTLTPKNGINYNVMRTELRSTVLSSYGINLIIKEQDQIVLFETVKKE